MALTTTQLKKRIKIWLWVLVIGLALSGITAFPIETELAWFNNHSGLMSINAKAWFGTIYSAVKITNINYPYLSYGTDWLAFAHLLLAVLFIGPAQDPIKNIWVMQFGIIACIAIFPLAFIAGNIRQIPLFWQLIDCSFGAIGIIPLLLAYRYTKKLTYLKTALSQQHA
ncbi:hypothetical protein D0C36_10145 [Mucilaginibacter conchicola]|uniref:Uncharacterized protein n=1 Tax=Mucilaginibacter conchicola TaxID=2303333 RepID=A0A372NRD1_9SPHI|nr:hypothetical protein [Mucilaginibacter conchicola]RFZ91805.1 hypothetical protein D0C36_10145 [Mucilaginibacter conchicola]